MFLTTKLDCLKKIYVKFYYALNDIVSQSEETIPVNRVNISLFKVSKKTLGNGVKNVQS